MKIQIRLHICAVWSESSQAAFRVAKDAKFLHVDNKDWSDCADAQADVSHPWTHLSEDTFLQDLAYIITPDGGGKGLLYLQYVQEKGIFLHYHPLFSLSTSTSLIFGLQAILSLYLPGTWHKIWDVIKQELNWTSDKKAL